MLPSGDQTGNVGDMESPVGYVYRTTSGDDDERSHDRSVVLPE